MISSAFSTAVLVGRRDVDRAVVLDVDRAPVWSTMPLIVLPPGPMIMRIWSGLTLIVVMRGAYCESSGRAVGERLEHLAEDVQARPRAPASSACSRIVARQALRS